MKTPESQIKYTKILEYLQLNYLTKISLILNKVFEFFWFKSEPLDNKL